MSGGRDKADRLETVNVACGACSGDGWDDAHRPGPPNQHWSTPLMRGPDFIYCEFHGDVGWGGHGLCTTCKGTGSIPSGGAS